GVVGWDRGEGGRGGLGGLDQNDGGGPLGEQRGCEAAGTGPDLDHVDAVEWPRRARDPGGEVEVEKKILAERFPGAETVSADYVAQRGQAVDRRHARRASGCASVRVARRAASRRAAMRLPGSARLVPAMSKAVP